MVRRQKKKNKFGAYVIMAFMVFLMVGSLLGVILYAPQPPGQIVYNDLEFAVDPATGMYTTTHDGQVFRFNNPPYTAASVPTDAQAIALLQNAPLMIVTFNPNADTETLQYIDFARFELAAIIPGLGGGVSQPSPAYPLPVIDCVNATPSVPVLSIESGLPAITVNGSCVTLTGNQTTLLLAKDALIYRYFNLLETTEQPLAQQPAQQPAQQNPM